MTHLYYERYMDTCFASDDLIKFNDVLQVYDSINDNELVLLIKRHGLRVFSIVRSVEDERGASRVYCHEFNVASLSDDHEIKSKILLRCEIEKLATSEPLLKSRRVAFQDSVNLKSEIAKLKEDIAHIKRSYASLESERDDLKKKMSQSRSLDGIAKSTAERWSTHVETAVTLAVYCVQNPEKYTEQQLNQICKKLTGNALAREALTAFKKALPSDLTQERGRPRAQTTNDKN